MLETDFKLFPTTRYQGSKRKILPWIYENVKDLKFHTVLDACGGSGSVSYLFKKMGKAVVYNDFLKFNSIIAKSIIQNQNIRFTIEDTKNLFEWISSNDNDSFIENTFRGIYYWRRENEWLDRVNTSIINMNHYHGNVLETKKAIAYNALFQSCLIKRPFNLFHRRNLNIRSRNVERNFGNKVTWDRPFEEYFTRFIHEINSSIFNSNVQCRVLNESIFEIEETDFDLVYIDPPYMASGRKNETSNYLKCYHFLEGLANYQEWETFIDTQTDTLQFLDQENKFLHGDIAVAFEELIEKFQESKIILSYKKGGTPSIETLVKLMKKYKKNVYTRSSPYVYALNRQNGNTKYNREVLIFGI